MNRISSILGVIALLAGLFGLWQHSKASQYRNDMLLYKARVEALVASNKSLASSLEFQAKKRREAERLYFQTKETLDEALKEHADWAGTPVPDSVWNAISGRTSP